MAGCCLSTATGTARSAMNGRFTTTSLPAKSSPGPPGKATPNITLAANFRETRGVPALDLCTSTPARTGHTSRDRRAHDMYGVKGFDGVAPGRPAARAQDRERARGGISTTGSVLRAMDYAITFAHQRRMPLIAAT